MITADKITVDINNMRILNQLSLHVCSGERVGIIGPNGHGKSVTMNTIAGLFKVASGNITLDDVDVTNESTQSLVERGIILVPEGGHLFPEMTVRENLVVGAYTKRAASARADSLDLVLSLFPKLKLLSASRANSLSGGELRMLAVGRGLMGKPLLLMLDEPTLGLAPNLVEEMGHTLNKIGKMGTSIILSDENMDIMRAFAERVYFIENGEVKVEGETSFVLDNPYVQRTYLGIE